LEKKRTKKNKEKKEAKKNEEELIKEARKQKTVTVVDGGSTSLTVITTKTAVWNETGQVSGQGLVIPLVKARIEAILYYSHTTYI
jgi:hypothetical protein